MNRAEIREAVRDMLGDPTEGFWTNAELDRYLQIACDEHARDALSVPTVESTTTLPGMQEYVLPEDFGEMRRVRYESCQDSRQISLPHVPKVQVLQRSSREAISASSEPICYYHDANVIGLYPIPNPTPVLSIMPESCETWQTVAAKRHASDDSVENFYSQDIYLKIEDICRVYCSHISLWMRRNARPISGEIQLRIHPVGRPDYEYYFSRPVNIANIGIEPEWLHFDFTYHPVELVPDINTYQFTFMGNTAFETNPRSVYGDNGVEFAVSSVNEQIYFQLHQFRQDLEIDYYKNAVLPIETDDQTLEIPVRYHTTLVKKVIARALRKGGRDLQNALVWETEINKEVLQARAQALLRTRGDRTQFGNRRGIGIYPSYNSVNNTWQVPV